MTHPPALQKWFAFVQNFNTHAQGVADEAEAGLAALIAQHALDYGPIGAAFSTTQARLANLEQKLEDAREQTSEELLEIDDRTPYIEFLNSFREVSAYWSDRFESLKMQKSAEWARQLQTHVQAEMARPTPCSNCGSNLERKVHWQAVNETCPHCRTVNSLVPGTACGLFFQGGGVEALCDEAAVEAWKVYRAQERAYERLRNHTAYDMYQLDLAVRGYWQVYFQTMQQLNPGWQQDLATAIDARVGNMIVLGSAHEQQAREFLGHIVEAGVNSDAQRLMQLMQALPQEVSLSDCCMALVERNLIPGATVAYRIAHQLGGESDPVEQWVQEEMSGDIATITSG